MFKHPSRPWFSQVLLAAGLLCLAACSPLRDNEAELARQGEECSEDMDCGPGLVCSAAALCDAPGKPGTAATDEACTTDADCRLGLLCSGLGLCGEERQADLGEACRDDTGCAAPLVCAADGKCQQEGAVGTIPADEVCETSQDCRFGLTCTADQRCTQLPRWSGVSCEDSKLPGSPRLLFEVPRVVQSQDFFRLPFPNDARLTAGVLDYDGFPGLETSPIPGELISRYVAAIGAEVRGFGPNSAALFRFSQQLDFDTLKFGGDTPTFEVVDITPDSEDRGRKPRARFFATTDRTRYICHNWLGIRPSEGTPLEAGHTYAILFYQGIRAATGEPLVADRDFLSVLAADAPEHPSLRAAWTRFAPLRAWLVEQGTPTDGVIGGTVFTVNDPRGPMTQIRAAVLASPALPPTQVTLCDGGTDSPCEGAGDRTCGDVNPLYAELHGRLELPRLISGAPPYEGGTGTLTPLNGTPIQVGTDSACFSVTVPRGAAPRGGFPVVIYAHDTGGHFREFVTNGFAARMARLGYAVIGMDGLLHGDRGGSVPLSSPEEISSVRFDLTRPERLRDLGFQEAADLIALVHAVPTLSFTTDDGTARFNARQLMFFGHGRGGEAGVLALAQEPTVRAVVLAGVGGGVVDQLQQTFAPENRAAKLQLALADGLLNGMHPALHLFQTWLDPVDPVNLAGLFKNPPEGVPAKHVFMLQGVGDKYTPRATATQLAIALKLERLGAALEPMDAVPVALTEAVRGNMRTVSGQKTLVVKQYDAAEGRGHYAAHESRDAVADLNQFFSTLLSDPEGIPTVGGAL